MKQSVVDYLICPTCSKNLTLKIKKKSKKEIIEGQLICLKRHRFLISGGIPNFVVDKSKTFVKTEDSFSSKWKKYNKTYHNTKWFNGQKKWFLERFGWKTILNFNNFLKTRTRILDAGTGVGNSAKLFSTNRKADVFAIDASESITFAYKKYGDIANIHFLKADITNERNNEI